MFALGRSQRLSERVGNEMKYVKTISVAALCLFSTISVARGQSVDSATVLPAGAVRDAKDPRIIRFGATPSSTQAPVESSFRAVGPFNIEKAREVVTRTLAPFFFEAIEINALNLSGESFSVDRSWVLQPVQLLSWLDQLRRPGVQYVEPAPDSLMYDFPGWLLSSQMDVLGFGLKRSADKKSQPTLATGISSMVSIVGNGEPDGAYTGRLEGCSAIADLPDWCRLTGVFLIARTPVATVVSLPIGGSPKEELVLAWPAVAPAAIDDLKRILVETRVDRKNEVLRVDVPLVQLESIWSVDSESAFRALWGKPVTKGLGEGARLKSAFSVRLLADQLAPSRTDDESKSINKAGNGVFFVIRRSDGPAVAMGWMR